MTSFKPLQIVKVSKSFLYLCPLRSDARLHLLTPGRFTHFEWIALYLWKSPRRPRCSYRHQINCPPDAAFWIRGTIGGQKWNTKKVIYLIYNKLLSSSKSCIGKWPLAWSYLKQVTPPTMSSQLLTDNFCRDYCPKPLSRTKISHIIAFCGISRLKAQ